MPFSPDQKQQKYRSATHPFAKIALQGKLRNTTIATADEAKCQEIFAFNVFVPMADLRFRVSLLGCHGKKLTYE